MPQFTPLPGQQALPPRIKDWLREPTGSKRYPAMTRGAAIANVVSSTARPTNPEQTIWDGYDNNEKLHDREPQLVIDELTRRLPQFWNGFPLQNKRDFIGAWCKTTIGDGSARYGKPALRVEEDVVVIT